MDTSKKVLFANAARQEILKGVEVLANAVRCTLGPRGRNVVIERLGQAPHVTKDGVTVAKSITLKNQFENLGAQMIKEVASQTVDVAGDGTTTATILAHAIYKGGLKLLASDHSSTELKNGIDYAVGVVTEQLRKNSISVEASEDIVHVGTVSANGDRSVGTMLANAMDKVGRDGVITVEEAKGYETTLEIVEGMRFNRGYCSPYFVSNSEKMTAELTNPYILITNKKFEHLKELLPVLEQIHRTKRPVLVIADDIDGEALHGLTVNKMRGTLDVCAVRAPEFGNSRHDALQDIAVLTGGDVVSDGTGIKISDINLRDQEQTILGECKRVIVTKNSCTIVGLSRQEDVVQKRVAEIRSQLEDPSLTEHEASTLQRRLSRLAGGVAIVRVGGSTEVEMRERKDRVDDALCATQAAVEAGIVAGGGVALVAAATSLEQIEGRSKDFNAGIEIIRDACFAPLSQIVENAGGSPDVVVNHIVSSNSPNHGWNADSEKYGDMFRAGIIDPVKVPMTALANAASVAGLMLMIDCAIAEEDPELIQKLMLQQ